jgi:hypothetical protein
MVRCLISHHFLMALGTFAAFFSLSAAHSAPCPDFSGTPVNESYTLDPNIIKQAIQDGCPPPRTWLTRENGFAESPTSTVFGSVQPSTTFAHTPPRTYQNLGCNTYTPTRAGGQFDNGAQNACQLGAGRGLFTLAPVKAAVPDVAQEEAECLGNLFSAIAGLLGGGGGNPSVQAQGSVSGNCVSGSIGICGIGSIGGRICSNGTAVSAAPNDGLPNSRNTPPQYVEITNVPSFDYANTALNQTSAVFLPQGGTVSDGVNSYTLAPGDFVTMDATGNVFLGRPGLSTYLYTTPTNPTGEITLTAGQFVTIVPTGGAIQVDSSLLTGNTIDGVGTQTTMTTVQGGNASIGQNAAVSPTVTSTTGASLTPDPDLGLTGPSAGAFPPASPRANELPPTENAGAPAAPQVN